MLNKRWRKRIIDTEYINERAVTTTILVNRQHIKLMSVYFLHSKYADQSCTVEVLMGMEDLIFGIPSR